MAAAMTENGVTVSQTELVRAINRSIFGLHICSNQCDSHFFLEGWGCRETNYGTGERIRRHVRVRQALARTLDES